MVVVVVVVGGVPVPYRIESRCSSFWAFFLSAAVIAPQSEGERAESDVRSCQVAEGQAKHAHGR